jgi:hypothetical protein
MEAAMVRPLSALALSLSLAALAPCAQAQVNITTTASNLHYTLADLNPADASAPAVRFGGVRDKQFLQASLEAFHGQSERQDDYRVNLVRDDAAATALENSWSGGGTVLSSFSPGGGVQEWESSTSTFTPRILNQSFYAFGRSRSPVQAFELAPHASMTVYLDIGTDMNSGLDPLSFQYGYGMATLYGALGEGAPQLSDQWSSGVGSGFASLALSEDHGLSLTFSNSGDTWMSGSFGWTVDSVANLYVAVPVPEPLTWEMFLAGLALLASYIPRSRADRSRPAPAAPARDKCARRARRSTA